MRLGFGTLPLFLDQQGVERRKGYKQTNKQIWLFPEATAKGRVRSQPVRPSPASNSPPSLWGKTATGRGRGLLRGRRAQLRGAELCLRGGVAMKGAGRGLGVGGAGAGWRSVTAGLAGATRAPAPRQAGFT